MRGFKNLKQLNTSQRLKIGDLIADYGMLALLVGRYKSRNFRVFYLTSYNLDNFDSIDDNTLRSDIINRSTFKTSYYKVIKADESEIDAAGIRAEYDRIMKVLQPYIDQDSLKMVKSL